MTTPELPDNSTLLLNELDIPGRTGPVSETPLVWGINLAAARENFPRQGLLCRAGPWAPMYTGDHVRVFLEPKGLVYSTYLDRDDVGKTLQMFIDPDLIDEGRSRVSYSVERVGQTEEPSVVMDVLVKLTRPGGDDMGDPAGHPKLIMRIPDEILDGGIDQDNVADGVDIKIDPYPDIAARDVIQVSWGGFFVLSAPLTEEQADGNAPIIVHVSEAVIREVGDSDDAGVAVVFEVYDLVDNRCEDWSYEQRVVVAVDASRLEGPILKEAVNNVLDVDKLADKNGTAQIIASVREGFKVGDVIVVRIKGTPVEGAPIDFEVHGQPLNNVPSVVEIEIPNAALRQLAKAPLALSYRVEKADNTPDLRSKTQFINVIGQVQRLAAPIVREAVSGALNPELARVTIEIPFDNSFAAGQSINLMWLGTRPDFSTYLPDLPPRLISNGDISAGKPLVIYVDKTHLTQINGGKVEVYYQLLIDDSVLGSMNRVNATHAIRESIHADILQVGAPRLELPEPEVAGVVDGVLPADTDGTTLTVVYLKTMKGDEVVYQWIGSRTGTASDSITLSTHTAGKPVPFTIPAELIKGNEGGTVSASYLIKRAAGGTSYANPLAFSVGVALDLKEPKIKEAPNDTSLDPLDAQTSLTAVVDYEGMLVGDKIIVHWEGAPSTLPDGSHSTEPWPVNTLGPQEIPLARSVLAFNLAKSVTLHYTVTRGSQEPKESTVRTLAIFQLRVDLLHSPKITQAANGGDGTELDVSMLTTAATVRTRFWPHIAKAQRVWMEIQGTRKDGRAYKNVVWTGPKHQVSSSWISQGYADYSMPHVDLQSLKHLSELTVIFKAALDRSTDENVALNFPVRTYTVKAVEDVKPAISLIKDSKGVEIPNASLTVDTSVTLTGTAAKGQKVQVLDGTTDKGQPDADPQTGIWTLTVTGLSVAAHSFTAKALYGTGQTSAARTLTVTAVVAPTIASVKGMPSNVEIPDGGTTIETSIVLTGVASKGQKVQVFDGTASKGEATADATTGIWTLTVASLTVAAHSFTAKALYGTGAPSAARVLTVIKILDIGPDKVMTVSGYSVIQGNPPQPAPPIAIHTQQATGGVLPYSYSSNNRNVAIIVNENDGVVVAAGNGTAIITVADTLGMTAKYTITISGAKVWMVVHNGQPTSVGSNAWIRTNEAISSTGTRLPTESDCRELMRTYPVQPNKQLHNFLFWLGGVPQNKYMTGNVWSFFADVEWDFMTRTDAIGTPISVKTYGIK